MKLAPYRTDEEAQIRTLEPENLEVKVGEGHPIFILNLQLNYCWLCTIWYFSTRISLLEALEKCWQRISG